MKGYIPGTHILWSEYACKHCGELPPNFYNEDREISIEIAVLFNIFEQVRKMYGHPISVTRGYSCLEYQEKIYLNKIKAIYGDLSEVFRIIRDPNITPFSVHSFGLALDIQPSKRDIPDVVKLLKAAEPLPRIGWKGYQSHIHFDLGFLIVPSYSKHLRRGAEW